MRLPSSTESPLTKRIVHYSRQFLGLIILDLGINVHLLRMKRHTGITSEASKYALWRNSFFKYGRTSAFTAPMSPLIFLLFIVNLFGGKSLSIQILHFFAGRNRILNLRFYAGADIAANFRYIRRILPAEDHLHQYPQDQHPLNYQCTHP